ncbi:MAG: hypothetical protein ACREBZ_06930 [Thermoplasmata archaeon]
MRMRHASGVRERDLVERARRVRDSVEPLLPQLTPECPTDRFDKLRHELEEVRENRDDASRLARMSRWGDPIVRAYAGLLKFQLEPEMPGLVSFHASGGEVSFAPLGKSTPEAEVAIQHFEDPSRLLLGYVEWARKGFHFFATPNRLWCTGKDPHPPAEFLQAKTSDLPYRLSEDADHQRYLCAHLAAHEPRPYVEVDWPGAGYVFRVCRKCVKGERQLLAALTEDSAVPDPVEEFPVEVALNADCRGGPECVHHTLPSVSRGVRRAYVLGRLSDAQFLSSYLEEIRPRVEATRRTTYVAGGTCFGNDRSAFLEALHPSLIERRALEAALEDVGGLFEIDELSASRALERLWGNHAEEIVHSIVSDPKEAGRYLDEGRHAPGRVTELLKRAQKRSQERELLDSLPHYDHLNREAAYVDAVARAYRTHGAAGAERVAVQSLPHEGKERGLAYGLLMALGRAASHAWQFSDSEKEFGQTLAPRATELLRASAEDYHVALDRLFQTAGVADWGRRRTTG